MRSHKATARSPDDPARQWYELADRTRILGNMVAGPQQAALLTLAEQYEATARRLARGFEATQAVLRGLRGYIRSNWELELLLLLARNPSRGWSIDELTAELRSSQRAIIEALGSLRAAGLAGQGQDGRHRYHPRTRDLADLVRRFEQACALLPLSVITAIFSSSN